MFPNGCEYYKCAEGPNQVWCAKCQEYFTVVEKVHHKECGNKIRCEIIPNRKEICLCGKQNGLHYSRRRENTRIERKN